MADGMKKKVFLVDDDRDLVFVTRSVLEAGGYRVETAFSGAEALLRIDDVAPDLLILDVMMEDTATGFDVLHKVRARDQFGGLPVILLTSVQQKTRMKLDDKVERGLVPAQAFIEKPVDPPVLLKKVAELLN